MYDLERVEVLRGPQGTLYGKNTTGGAVNIISRDAKLGETSGYLNAGYGNYNRLDAQGAVNVALGDNLAVRVAGTFAQRWLVQERCCRACPTRTRRANMACAAPSTGSRPTACKLILRASHSYQNPHNYGIYAQDGNSKRIGGLGNYQVASA
jgi:iron complex outermembrane receptor protein